MRATRLLNCWFAALAAAMLIVAPAARANFTVDDLSDDLTIASPDAVCDAAGPLGCTLREALNEANDTPAADTISFSVSGTISPLAQFTILNPTTIDGNGSGSGAGDTVIEGADAFRLFLVNGAPVTFKDLRLEDGGIADPGGDGGAAIRTADPVTLTNVVASSNQITGVGGGQGGAILSTTASATLTLTDTIVSGNTISSDGVNNGGGISAAGDLSLDRSVVSQNTISAGSSQQGGGLLASEDLSVVESTIVTNSVSGGGGQGGGIFTGANLSTRSISNSTISGNQAPADGGGGLRLNSAATLTNVTLANNGDAGAGAGDDLVQAAETASVQNSIFASPDPCLESGGSIVSASPGHNIDEGVSCDFGSTGGNLENTDPMFSGGLNLFGGGQQIIIPLWNSPTIDNADPTCGGGLATDQRGRERPQGPSCDVGAYERDYRTLSVSRTGAGSGSVTGTGISCGGDCDEMLVDGTLGLVLTATPSSGSQFTSWSGCDSVAGNECTLDLGNDRAVTATFSLTPAPPPTTSPPPTTTTKKKKKKKCKKKKSKGKSAASAKKKKCKKKKK